MGYAPNYQLIVDRVNNLDTLEIRLEMTPELFSDVTSELENTQRKISSQLRDLLGISAKVTLVAPGSITRSEGKAVRIIDHRKLHD